MPPQTKPIDSRFADLRQAATKFMAKSQKSGDANQKAQVDAAKAVQKATESNLRLTRQVTAELTKQVRLHKQLGAPVARGGASSPMGGGSGGSKGGKQSLGSALGMRKWLGPAAATALVGSIVGVVSSQMRASIDTFSNTVKTQRDVSGMIDATSVKRLTRRGAEKDLGYGPAEVLNAVQGLGRAVGVQHVGDFPTGGVAGLLKSQQRYGISSGEGLNLMGGLRQAGITGFDDQNGKKGAGLRAYERIMAAGVASGLEKTRVPEHMQNVSKGMQAVGANISGAVDAEDISSMMASLGKLGAGFQGKRGGGIMMALQNMFSSVGKGGGGAAEAWMLQDVGDFGGPASKNSYFEARKQLDKGFSSENVKRLIDGQLRKSGGATESAALELSSRSNGQISVTNAEKLLVAGSKGLDGKKDMDAIINKIKPLTTEDYNKKAVKLASEQAQVQLKQFEVGKQLLDEVVRVQLLIAQLVDGLVPAVKSMLNLIGDLLGGFNRHFGSNDPKSGTTQVNLDRLEKIKKLPVAQQQEELAALLKGSQAEVTELQGLQTQGQLTRAKGESTDSVRARALANRERKKLLPAAEEARDEIQAVMNTNKMNIARKKQYEQATASRVEELRVERERVTTEKLSEAAEALKESAADSKKSSKIVTGTLADTAQRAGGTAPSGVTQSSGEQ